MAGRGQQAPCTIRQLDLITDWTLADDPAVPEENMVRSVHQGESKAVGHIFQTGLGQNLRNVQGDHGQPPKLFHHCPMAW